MYQFDKRVVMTLDAGGTNFVFSAMQSNEEIITPVCLPSYADNLQKCMNSLTKGFSEVKEQLQETPVAISFAFPGPADYENGIIGDLPNLKAFRGGVALGPFLKETFGIPVYINNDGNLFAYGEAIGGLLPEINKQLALAGSPKRYKNLLGVTMGTGFGGGIVTDGILQTGDNGTGGDIWVFRHKKFRDCITEESVGIAAVKRMYAEFSGNKSSALTPKDIYDIAAGRRQGNRGAALITFEELGEEAGDTIAHAITLVDGLIVIGGGLSAASEFFMPALMREMNGTISKLNGENFSRLQMKAYHLDNQVELEEFLKGDTYYIPVPGTTNQVLYDKCKRVGVAVSRLGTSKAISLGAYAYALQQLDKLQ